MDLRLTAVTCLSARVEGLPRRHVVVKSGSPIRICRLARVGIAYTYSLSVSPALASERGDEAFLTHEADEDSRLDPRLPLHAIVLPFVLHIG